MSTTGTRGCCRPRQQDLPRIRANWRGWMPGSPPSPIPGWPSATSWRPSWRCCTSSAARRPSTIEAGHVDGPDYPALLRRVLDADRFPALAAAVEAGVFDDADNDHLAEFRSGLAQLIDGIAARIATVATVPRSHAWKCFGGGSIRTWRQAKRRRSPIRHRAHARTVMTSSRSTRTSSCCSARRVTWRDAS